MAIFSSLPSCFNKELGISPDTIIGERTWTPKIWVNNDGFIFIADVDSNETVRFEQQLQIEAGDILYVWYSSLKDVTTFVELHNRGIHIVLVKQIAVEKGWALTKLEILDNSNKVKNDGF